MSILPPEVTTEFLNITYTELYLLLQLINKNDTDDNGSRHLPMNSGIPNSAG